jgi:hypothetical protein
MALRPLVPVLKNLKKIIIDNWQELSEAQLAEEIEKNNGGNVGVRLDHYAVIDPDEPAAEMFVGEWEKRGILPPTVSWKTARGFTKRLYKRPSNWPFESNTINVQNMKLQLRSGPGVQDVIPPSYVIDKIKKFEGHYTWIPGRDPDSIDPSDLPQEILVHFLRYSQPEIVQSYQPSKPFTGNAINVEKYLEQYQVEVVRAKPYKDGTLYCLRQCIFNPDHQPNEAAIFQAGDGKLSYQCFHDTCKGRTWHEAKSLISGQDLITKVSSGEAPADHKNNSTSSKGWDKNELLKGLRDNKLSPEQKAHIVKLIEQSAPEKSIADKVRDYVFGTEEDFNRTFLVKEMGFWDNLGHREAAYKALTRLKDEGIITNVGRRGYYRKIEGEAEKINFMEAKPEDYWKAEWPFRLHNLVKIFPRNLVVVAGATNAGKTAFLLEFCRRNAGKKGMKIRYISTEMNDVELRQRLEYYAADTGEFYKPLEEWNEQIDFRFHRQSRFVGGEIEKK